MASDLQKYKAQIFQIIGIGFTAPLGKVVLDAFDIEFDKYDLKLLSLFLIAFFFAVLGIILMFKGSDHLDEKVK